MRRRQEQYQSANFSAEIFLSSCLLKCKPLLPTPPAVLLAGGAVHTYSNNCTRPRRSGGKAFTQFFLEKIAGAGRRPAAARVGHLWKT